jgi:hypothetical protein
MKRLMRNVEVGCKYVSLDGAFFSAQAAPLNFDGWHSHHDLDYVPQVAALKDRRILEKILANREYWEASALKQD